MTGFNFDTVRPGDHPQNNINIMIDTETLGVDVGAPVITIGATLFDPFTCDSSEELLRRSLLIRVDIQDAVDLADRVDGNTVRWWFEQNDDAIKALVGDDAISMKEALLRLFNYCSSRIPRADDDFFQGISQLPPATSFWAKDPDFDMRLLEFFYQKLDIQKPWKFYDCRSVRTVQDLAWPNGRIDRPSFEIPGVAHDARWDAISQALTIQAAIYRLGQSRDQDVEFKTWNGVK